MVLGQPPPHFAQVLPRMLERPPETATGGPQLFAALDLRGADLRRDPFELCVEKLPEVREGGPEGARPGALDCLQGFLDTGGAGQGGYLADADGEGCSHFLRV